MTSEVSEQKCCVYKCVNTPSNSDVKIFSFPMPRIRLSQRNKWFQAIQNINGHNWIMNTNSLVCGEHFISGHPSTDPQNPDYVPSVFKYKKTPKEAKIIPSHTVTVKKFALEYIKHEVLLGRPNGGNKVTRQRAYAKLAEALDIPLTTVRSWERRFKDYFNEKMAEPPDKRKSADGKPHWSTTVAKKLKMKPIINPLPAQLLARGPGSRVSPSSVVDALCMAARARDSLCCTPMYNDVRRMLRLGTGVNALHAIWVSAQRVSLQQVALATRAGDARTAAPPPTASAVVDLVLLHTDVDILTDESVTLYEESAALHTLWQLIQRHRLEDAAPAHSRVRAQRWTRAYRTYIESGRTVSLIVLQRRWYELKLQARVRLAMHWRRPPGPDDLTPAPDPPPDPSPTPHKVCPRPAPLHIAILKRYPHIATGPFPSWRQQVLDGTIVTELLDVEDDVKETQSSDNEQSTTTIETGNDAAVKQPDPDLCKVERTFDVPVVEQPPGSDPLITQPAVTDLLEQSNVVKETKTYVSKHSTNSARTGADATVMQIYPKICKVEQLTFDVPMVQQPPDSASLIEKPGVSELLKEENVKETGSNVSQKSTDTADTGADAAVKQLSNIKVEQPSVDEPDNGQTFYVPLIEQSTVVERTTDNEPSAQEFKVPEIKIEPIESGSLIDKLWVEQRPVNDLSPEPKIEQVVNYDHCEVSGKATTKGTPVIVDTKGRPDISSEQTHHAKDKSSPAVPRERAGSDDTDTENNLVIDERSNQTPCSHKQGSVPHTETHSVDTVSPHAALRNSAPTIEVLQMIDPKTVKTEILFESDEDEFEPTNVGNKDEIKLDTKKEALFIGNRIKFEEVDEKPVSSDVKIEDDVTDRMDLGDGQEYDVPVNNTQTIDPKLLMETQVRVFRIDEIPAWIKNVRKDNSIRVSRIHRRYYTPNFKNVRKGNTRKCTENTDSNVGLQPSTRLSKTQETMVDKHCLQNVANTYSIRRLCSNLKRERIDDRFKTLEDETPNKKAKSESDSDDDRPLLVLREGKPPRETNVDEGSRATVRRMVEESSSDEELMNNTMVDKLGGGEEQKRKRGAYYAASTIEWSSAFAPALGRVPKRVSLPDLESVRRHNSGIQVAQVAPITSTMDVDGDAARQAAQSPDDTATDNTSEAASAAPAQHTESETWDDARGTDNFASQSDLPAFQGNGDMTYDLLPSSRDKPLLSDLDLPADDELQAALDGLTTMSMEPLPERSQSHCCAARRHREVNDSRRRIGLDDIPLHNHPDGVCTCCCSHLSDADARSRLEKQLRVLHQDIEDMLRRTEKEKLRKHKKSAGGRTVSKPALNCSRSASPAPASTSTTATTSVHKQATKDAPPNTPTVAKVPKTKQATCRNAPKTKQAACTNGPKTKQAACTNGSKKSCTQTRAAPTPAPPVSDFEEWQRQKNMNAKYFHINSNISFKKEKTEERRTGPDVAKQSTSTKSTSAQGSVMENTAKGTATQRPIAQDIAVQFPITQDAAVQISTAQDTAVQSPIVQGRDVGVTTAQDTAFQILTAQSTAVQIPTAQGSAVHCLTPQGPAVQSLIVQGPGVQNLIVQSPTVQSFIVQGPALQSLIAQGPAQESPTAQGPAEHSTTSQTGTNQSTISQNAVRPGLMPYIRQSRLLSPQKTKRVGPAKSAPFRQNNLIALAPKPEICRTTENTQPNTVGNDLNEITKNLSIRNFQSPAAGKRRMNLTAEQVAEPNLPVPVTTLKSEPTDKPVSILEEYSRTLNMTPNNNTPVVNAVSLRVPYGPEEIKTTVVMTLNLPPNGVIQQRGNSLYANDTVDLTEEPEITDSVIRNTITPVLTAAMNSVRNTGNQNKNSRSLLKPVSATKSVRNVLKTKMKDALNWVNYDPSATKRKYTKKMKAIKKLPADEVIEIEDTDSNHSNSSGGNQSENTTVINQISNPLYANKVSSQATAGSTMDSYDQSTSKAQNSNQAARDGNESNEGASQVGTTNSTNQAIHEDLSSKTPNETRKLKRRGRSFGVQEGKKTVISRSVLSTDIRQRCLARFANVDTMTIFMAKLRRATAMAEKVAAVYCHQWSAPEHPVSLLPCGATLLCVDAVLAPLELFAKRASGRVSPWKYLVLTDADLPCSLPTYWTLAAVAGKMARVLPDELVSTARVVPDVPHGDGARGTTAHGDTATPKEEKSICESYHDFKVLTAFCSADGIRQAARLGATLLLLNVQRTRVVILTLRRDQLEGRVRHHASADVEQDVLRELERLLDEAEDEEQLAGGTDVIGNKDLVSVSANEEPAGKSPDQLGAGWEEPRPMNEETDSIKTLEHEKQ